MNRRFDIQGLLGVAVRDEQSGAQFYRKLTEQADSEERDHLVRLANLKDALGSRS